MKKQILKLICGALLIGLSHLDVKAGPDYVSVQEPDGSGQIMPIRKLRVIKNPQIIEAVLKEYLQDVSHAPSNSYIEPEVLISNKIKMLLGSEVILVNDKWNPSEKLYRLIIFSRSNSRSSKDFRFIELNGKISPQLEYQMGNEIELERGQDLSNISINRQQLQEILVRVEQSFNQPYAEANCRKIFKSR